MFYLWDVKVVMQIRGQTPDSDPSVLKNTENEACSWRSSVSMRNAKKYM